MIKAIVVDDERDAVEVLAYLLTTHCKGVKIVATANSVKEGISKIVANKPDVVFLDVEMADGSGFEILKNLNEINFSVIFVSAHNHYAINAIKFSAMDYLLKPVDADELISAVEKAHHLLITNKYFNYDLLTENLLSDQPGKLAIPIKDGFQYVPVKQIVRIEADGSYSHFHLDNGKKIMVSLNLGVYDDILSKSNFYRTHYSHLINLGHVHQFLKLDGGMVIMSDNSRVPVSRRNKEGLMKMIPLLK